VRIVLSTSLLELILSVNELDVTMSLEQILEELSKLAPEERRRIFELLAQLESQDAHVLTPEESAAIDEAIRSLEAGKGVPASAVRQRFTAKWSR
jgi:hypothetical protein